jgi:hypothetical protein
LFGWIRSKSESFVKKLYKVYVHLPTCFFPMMISKLQRCDVTMPKHNRFLHNTNRTFIHK